MGLKLVKTIQQITLFASVSFSVNLDYGIY